MISLIILIFLFIDQMNGINFGWGPCIWQYLEPCSDEIIQFYLFNNDQHTKVPIQLNFDKPIIPTTPTSSSIIDNDIKQFKNSTQQQQIKVIVHGYAGHLDFYATKIIRDAYINHGHGGITVIVVDWGKLAMLPCYPTAVLNTQQAGECLGKFLINIRENIGGGGDSDVQFQQIHMIGFSLGAHVAAYASNIVRHKIGLKFDRITGLDPALPFFATIDHTLKLDQTDARFVDVIHTNAGTFGKLEPSGHVDFYLNGGQIQPACDGEKNVPLCSHMLSTVYYAESIISKIGFWGTRCKSYFQYLFGWCRLRAWRLTNKYLMGEYCKTNSRGIVFIETNLRPPYALGLAKNIKPSKGK